MERRLFVFLVYVSLLLSSVFNVSYIPAMVKTTFRIKKIIIFLIVLMFCLMPVVFTGTGYRKQKIEDKEDRKDAKDSCTAEALPPPGKIKREEGRPQAFKVNNPQ
jgi:hypothetical protein